MFFSLTQQRPPGRLRGRPRHIQFYVFGKGAQGDLVLIQSQLISKVVLLFIFYKRCLIGSAGLNLSSLLVGSQVEQQQQQQQLVFLLRFLVTGEAGFRFPGRAESNRTY